MALLPARPYPIYSAELAGLCVYINGVLADPDGNAVTVEVVNTDNQAVLVPAGTPAIREAAGIYQYQFNSDQTSILGNYQIVWSYVIGGSPRLYTDPFVIVPEMPWWQSLQYDERQIVVNIWNRVNNTIDSPYGGPYLQQLQSANFNAYEKIAFVLANETMSYFNFEFQPAIIPPYQIGWTATNRLNPQWYGLLEYGGYVAFLNHLTRSYIEWPELMNSGAAYPNRDSYYQRWENQWKKEKDIYDKMLRQFKRSLLVGSQRSMLIAGGLVPRLGLIMPTQVNWLYSSVSTTGSF